MRLIRSIRQFASKAVILGCVGYTLQDWIAEPWYLEDTSMEPTLKGKDIVLTSSWDSNLARGNIVILKHPQNPLQYVCKRVKALPGDTISYKNEDIVIRDGHFWLEGDNKSSSIDSRHFGDVPIGLMRGKVIMRLLPPKWFPSTQLS